MNKPVYIAQRPYLKKLDFSIGSLCHRQNDEMHMHNFTQIWYVLSGTLVHTIDDKTYLQTPGTCISVPPHIVHNIDTTTSEDTPIAISITFNDAFLTSRGYTICSYYDKNIIFDKYRIPCFYKFPDTQRAWADSLIRSMLSEFTATPKASFDELARLLADYLRLLCIKCEDSRITDRFSEQLHGINKAIDFLETHYAEKITLKDLCSLTAMTHPGFTKKFKYFTGFTSIEYLHILRLSRARKLLTFSDDTLDKIAWEVGLYDKSRLIHAFREYYGLSPTEYRTQSRERAYRLDFNTKPRTDKINNMLYALEQNHDEPSV
ncbi:MAG: helix-turn-helix transcriptional regulator [Oscillospiraceae bacterium]|nr:helix-turn-helix transcriptional regulator [Oscillospiraceae bacterium]